MNNFVMGGGAWGPVAERSYFSEAGVVVTNARLAHQGKTFAMANVTSVNTSADGIGHGIVLIALALALFLVHVPLAAVILLALAALAIHFRRRYLLLHAAGGEQHTLCSRDAHFIGRVMVAVNEAIAHRG